jgi:hypothetical protein
MRFGIRQIIERGRVAAVKHGLVCDACARNAAGVCRDCDAALPTPTRTSGARPMRCDACKTARRRDKDAARARTAWHDAKSERGRRLRANDASEASRARKRAYAAARRAADPEATRARGRADYQKHREKRLAAMKAKHERNRERRLAQMRANYAANAEARRRDAQERRELYKRVFGTERKPQPQPAQEAA